MQGNFDIIPMTADGQPLSRDQRFALFVLDRMARVLRHDLPLVATLRGMLREPELARHSPKAAQWRERVGMLAGDLDQGAPLHQALDRHMAPYLPPYFVPALRAADASGKLTTVFPLLVRNLTGSLRTFAQLRAALTYPVVQFSVLMSVLMGVMIFIVPKFFRMFEEMGVNMSTALRALILLCEVVHRFAPFLIVLVGAFAAVRVLCLLSRRSGGIRRATEPVLLVLPGVGRYLRQTATAQATNAMAAFLAADVDVPDAAELSAQSMSSPWARRQLSSFAARARAGTAWPDAWEHLRLGTNLTDWAIRNAAARECPQDGFQTAGQWLIDDLNRWQRRIVRWTEPCCILANSIIVGWIVWSLAGSLFNTIFAIL